MAVRLTAPPRRLGGLANPLRAHNCFLNVALQVFWHSPSFQRALLEWREYVVFDGFDLPTLLCDTFAQMAQKEVTDSEMLRTALETINPDLFLAGACGERRVAPRAKTGFRPSRIASARSRRPTRCVCEPATRPERGTWARGLGARVRRSGRRHRSAPRRAAPFPRIATARALGVEDRAPRAPPACCAGEEGDPMEAMAFILRLLYESSPRVYEERRHRSMAARRALASDADVKKLLKMYHDPWPVAESGALPVQVYEYVVAPWWSWVGGRAGLGDEERWLGRRLRSNIEDSRFGSLQAAREGVDALGPRAPGRRAALPVLLPLAYVIKGR